MKLTIITINRNNAAGLVRTLESTFDAQSGFDDWEQIVVDVASTDGSVAILDKWKENPHLGWHVSEPDRGIYNAMNKGAAHARGDYLLFLNSGDALLPNVLEKVFDEPLDADIAYGDELVCEKHRSDRIWSVPLDDLTPAFFLLSGFPHQSCFIALRWFSRMGGYDESLRIVGDTEFLLRSRLEPCVRIVRLPYVISRYPLDGISSNPDYAARRLEERERVMAPYFGSYAAGRVAKLLSEDRPWISATTVAQARKDAALAQCLRRMTNAVSALWNYRIPKFLMKAGFWCIRKVSAPFQKKKHA